MDVEELMRGDGEFWEEEGEVDGCERRVIYGRDEREKW